MAEAERIELSGPEEPTAFQAVVIRQRSHCFQNGGWPENRTQPDHKGQRGYSAPSEPSLRAIQKMNLRCQGPETTKPPAFWAGGSRSRLSSIYLWVPRTQKDQLRRLSRYNCEEDDRRTFMKSRGYPVSVRRVNSPSFSLM